MSHEAKRPFISVCMMTYNHEEYISKALDSILCQKTKNSFEIVIGDDCSTDNTTKIIADYEKKYPGIIKLESNKTNLGIGENFSRTFLRCSGEYVFHMDGDDYLLDDETFEKQCAFLETHPDYIGVCTQNTAIDSETGKTVATYPESQFCNNVFSISDFLSGHNYPSTGCLYKNVGNNDDGRKEIGIIPQISKHVDDFSFCVIMLMYGPVFILPWSGYAYRRIRKKGASNYNSIMSSLTKINQHVELYNNLNDYYCGRVDLGIRYRMLIEDAFWYCIKHRMIRAFHAMYKSIPHQYKENHLLPRCILSAFKRTKRAFCSFLKKGL